MCNVQHVPQRARQVVDIDAHVRKLRQARCTYGCRCWSASRFATMTCRDRHVSQQMLLMQAVPTTTDEGDFAAEQGREEPHEWTTEFKNLVLHECDELERKHGQDAQDPGTHKIVCHCLHTERNRCNLLAKHSSVVLRLCSGDHNNT